MAGIGFELRRMMDDGQSLMSRVRGYACAGLISSGPWIMTIVTLGVLSAFGSDGSFTYAPNADFNGSDEFCFVIGPDDAAAGGHVQRFQYAWPGQVS